MNNMTKKAVIFSLVVMLQGGMIAAQAAPNNDRNDREDQLQ